MRYDNVNEKVEMERRIATEDMTPVMLVLSIAQMYQDEMDRQCTALKLGAGARRVMYHLSLEEGVTQLSLVKATGTEGSYDKFDSPEDGTGRPGKQKDR